MILVPRCLRRVDSLINPRRLRPLIFLAGVLLLLIGVARLVASAHFTVVISLAFKAAAAMFGLLALASWARAAIRRATTELAVTDRRVIYKAGLLARHTLEMNRSKVESVDVDQSILGRIFGFGTIIVRGTGGSLEPIRMINDPFTFRSHF